MKTTKTWIKNHKNREVCANNQETKNSKMSKNSNELKLLNNKLKKKKLKQI
jgi:hypothetical protein